MSISPIGPMPASSLVQGLRSPLPPSETDNPEKLKEEFQNFVGETCFGQMLRSMRKTVDKPEYTYGGRAEEVFQQQLDQLLVEKVTEASAERFAEPMYELFTMGK